MSNYYLPDETAQLLTTTRVERCKNLGLILDKYVPKRVIEVVDRMEGDKKKNNERSDWLKNFQSNNHIDRQLVESVYTRWVTAIQAMHAQPFTAATDWRMVVGLGGKNVLETNLTLHHLYGIPFIPGSALKGLTRAYVTSEVEGHKSKKIDDDDKDVKRIFGTQDASGSVIFFDAMPVNDAIEIKLDIMNAHYPKYYGEKRLPTNTQDPNPVTFLTVTNTTFTFALAPRRPHNTKDVEDVELVKGWLQKALHEYGIGGKTSAGYGYLTVLEQQTNKQSTKTIEPVATPVDPEMSRVEDYIRELHTLKDSDVAGGINRFYQRWQQAQSNEARTTLAQAIVGRVRQAGREKQSADKAWYKDLREFLDNVK